MKKEKGITLIALVITIIVLLILAGITIMNLTEENGILSKASTAKEKTKREEGKETIKFAITEMTIDLSVKGEKLTIDYIGNHIHEKLGIDKENVTKDGEPTEKVDVRYGDYEYEIDDNFQIEVLGSLQEVVTISYTYERVGEEGIIHLTVKTEDEQGIKKIIKPDGEIVEYTNKEKEVTMDYTVKQVGKYKFTAEANNGNTKSKIIYVLEDLSAFNIMFHNDNDFLPIEEAYAKTKETLIEEQDTVISEATSLVSNSLLYNAIKNDSDNSWTLLGEVSDRFLENYYLYDKYSVNTTTTYVQGTWSAWGSNESSGLASNNSVAKGYTLNSDGTFTTHTMVNGASIKSGDIYYGKPSYNSSGGNVGRTITRYKCTSSIGVTVQASTMTSVAKESYTIKSFEDETISKTGILPDDGVYSKDKKWYKKKEQANPYYLYKYQNKEIQSTYDIEKQTINTRKIDLMKNREIVKILVDANNKDYKLSISKDNQNWIQTDNTILNGEAEITLPEQWNSMYIKIEKNNSVINQIVVKY